MGSGIVTSGPAPGDDRILARLAAAHWSQHGNPPAAAAKPVFEIGLLGRPHVTFVPPNEASRPVAWRLRRAFELVACLALAPDRWLAREALTLALWPDSEPSTVARNFHPTISDARGALARAAGQRLDTVIADQGGYQLSEAVIWRVDVDRFRHHADLAASLQKQDSAAALTAGRRAWRLYRGVLLSSSHQPWADTARQELQHRYHRLLQVVASLAAEAGRLEEAMDAYRTLLIDDPYAESIHLALIEIYARQRRPDLVRRQFMRLEDLLRELDVEPAEATRARYLALVSTNTKSEPFAG